MLWCFCVVSKMAFICLLYICVCIFTDSTNAVGHRTAVVWTSENAYDDQAHIGSVIGDPKHWVENTNVSSRYGLLYFTLESNRVRSTPSALAFQYATQTLAWADIGFKEIFSVHLENIPDEGDFKTTSNVSTVYKGLSTQVYGLTIDWLAGTIYWTDALYNWVSMASLHQYDVYRHVVVTGLDQPWGIAVHPMKGYLFWSDRGIIPRIERSLLDGTQRQVIYTENIHDPRGMTIDYQTNRVMWVDASSATLEMVDLDGRYIDTVYLERLRGTPIWAELHPFDVTLNDDYIFITERTQQIIDVYRKTDTKHPVRVLNVRNGGYVPMGVVMYDDKQQKPHNTACSDLGCTDICVSTGDGGGKCVCRQGYTLDSQNICVESGHLKPQYIFTVTNNTHTRICRTHVAISDREDIHHSHDIDCFLDVTSVSAIAVHVYAELLYYATGKTLIRQRLVGDMNSIIIAVSDTDIRALAIDYINSNIYWVDESHMRISRLDGSYVHLVKGTPSNSPYFKVTALAVHPNLGKMFWSSNDGHIMHADMDGGNPQQLTDSNFKLNSIVVDPNDERLYFSRDGALSSYTFDGQFKSLIHSATSGHSYTAATVYQDYIAYAAEGNTLTGGAIIFGLKTGAIRRNITMDDNWTPELIVTYDDYLQPEYQSLCDINNGGCEHLCVPTAAGKSCVCAIGYKDVVTKCVSDLQIPAVNTTLLLDRYQKQVFQIRGFGQSDLDDIQGFILPETVDPKLMAYSIKSNYLYWYDAYTEGPTIKKIKFGDQSAESILTLNKGDDIGGMVVDDADVLHYHIMNSTTNTIYVGNSASAVQGDILKNTLTLDRYNRKLYWIEYNKSDTNDFSIRMLPLITHNNIPQTYTTFNLDKPVGMTVDYDGALYVWSSHTIIRFNGPSNKVKRDAAQAVRRNRAKYDGTIVSRDETWVYTRTKRAMDREDSDQLTVSGDNIQSVTVGGNYIFISQANKRALYKQGEPFLDTEAMTSKQFPIFSGIVQVLAIEDPENINSTAVEVSGGGGGDSAKNLTMVIGVAVGPLVLVLIVIVGVAFFFCQRRRQKPKLNNSTHAHDNPTYMDHRQVPTGVASPVEAVGGAVGGDGISTDEKDKEFLKQIKDMDANQNNYNSLIDGNSTHMHTDLNGQTVVWVAGETGGRGDEHGIAQEGHNPGPQVIISDLPLTDKAKLVDE